MITAMLPNGITEMIRVPAPGGTKPRGLVFVVDDDPAVLGGLAFLLAVEGMSAVTHRDAAAALADPLIHAAGCLVIDQSMPAGDGLDLLTRLRNRGVGAPAILMTSHPSPALRQRAREAGATLVEKPLLGPALSDAIDAAFTVPEGRLTH